jgi:hypothetical protein
MDAPEGGWGLNVGGFMRAHPDWLIGGAAGPFGWTAQRRDGGRAKGPKLVARTLDELAALIEAS